MQRAENRRTDISLTIIAVVICAFLYPAALPAQTQTPHNLDKTPWPIPGMIEVENYDDGGESVAYHDADATNNGGEYRPTEGVDIEQCDDGGYNIGWTQPGEWLEYTVSVASTGSYKLDIRCAAYSDSGSINISFGGVVLVYHRTMPVTGGWQTWTTVTVPHLRLTKGVQVMRITCNTANFNLSSVLFSAEVDTKYPVVTLTSPADSSDFHAGEMFTISATASDTDGTIQSVDFYWNSTKIFSDVTAPYEMQYSALAPGTYLITAVATDDAGAFTLSRSVTVIIHQPNLPDSPHYSVEHGFYASPFDLTVSWDSAGSQIRYTLDGSDPKTSSTSVTTASPAVIHIDPSNTSHRFAAPAVPVRALAIVNNAAATDAGSQTYIFIDKVKTQKYPGGNWPSGTFGTTTADYAMDPDVVNSTAYRDQIDDALLQIPTICINTDVGSLFDANTGIYNHPTGRGMDWERPASVELIDPHMKEPGFQINCGLRLRGGYSRIGAQPKHAFRFFFRDEYGKGKLKYPLFGDEGVSEFDCVDLRTAMNYSWSYMGWSSHVCIFVRDLFSRICQRDMGQPYTRSRNYQLFLDGLYWGLYQTEERPEASYGESYFGGSKNDYDVVKVNMEAGYTVEATDGNLDAYTQLYNASTAGFQNAANYFMVQGKNPDGSVNPAYADLVKVDNLIDYMLIIFYSGNFDSPISAFLSSNNNPNNFYTMRNRSANSAFVYFIHDAEHALMDPQYSENQDYGEDRTGPFYGPGRYNLSPPNASRNNPQWIHERLMQNPEYRVAFSDHIYRHFFNNGALTPRASQQRLAALTADIDTAVIAESARWGDSKNEPPRTKNDDWVPAVDWLMNDYFPTRTSVVLQQLKDANLYPSIDPPVIMSASTEVVDTILFLSPGSTIRLVNNNPSQPGSIKYTLDGTDPRLIGGAVNPSATDGGDEADIIVSANVVLNTRILNGATWSAVHRIILYTGETQHGLKITEINYNPSDDGDISGQEFEFIELKNVGSTPISLGGATFAQGFEYTFPAGYTMPVNSFCVLASDSVMFKRRYGFAPNGQYNLRLDNGGERLTIVGLASDTILTVHYRDKYPWPESADGGGYSIVAKNANGYGNPDSASYWRASIFLKGSPGRDDIETGIGGGSDAIPVSFKLEQNFPNPFNPETVIRYQLAKRRFVELTVYDIIGREIATLVHQEQNPGTYSVRFPASSLSSGVYFYRLKAGEFTATNKMVLVR